jgi:hypothetical protein
MHTRAAVAVFDAGSRPTNKNAEANKRAIIGLSPIV